MNEHDRFIRMREVENLVGLKDSRIYQLIKSDEEFRFPPPLKLGAASRWSELEVRAWMAERKAEARAK